MTLLIAVWLQTRASEVVMAKPEWVLGESTFYSQVFPEFQYCRLSASQATPARSPHQFSAFTGSVLHRPQIPTIDLPLSSHALIAIAALTRPLSPEPGLPIPPFSLPRLLSCHCSSTYTATLMLTIGDSRPFVPLGGSGIASATTADKEPDSHPRQRPRWTRTTN